MAFEQSFWDWFLEHEDELFEFNPSNQHQRDKLFDALHPRLQKVDPDLVFEFGPKAPKREFVISADGIRRAFPAVVSLSKCAPSLDRWTITAFRPRRPVMVVEIEGKRVDPAEVRFTLLDNGKITGINLFIPGFDEKDFVWKQIGYLMLDESLGEFDVETRLGLIQMLPPESNKEGDRHPLAELPVLFDQVVSRLENRSKKPS